MGMHFADKVLKKVKKTSPIVVGIDPNLSLLPKALQPNTAEEVVPKLIQFSEVLMDATVANVPAIKIQAAYFEQFGTIGVAAMSEVIKLAKERDLLVIMDAKRGDIGSTSTAYATAYLTGETRLPNGETITSDLSADALTINPFMGDDSVLPFIEAATQKEKGLFILIRTSNPGASLIQEQTQGDSDMSGHLAKWLTQLSNAQPMGSSGYSHLGAVVGATVSNIEELREAMPHAIFLSPGLGAQGGSIEAVRKCFKQGHEGAVIPISRGLYKSSSPDVSVSQYQDEIKESLATYLSYF